MAAGFLASPYPSLEEHEAYQRDHHRRIQELRELNARHEREKQRLARSCDALAASAEASLKTIVDLEDRGKLVRIVSAAANMPNSGPLPHEFYQEQTAKVRDKSMTLLSAEAEKMMGDGSGRGSSGAASPGPRRVARGVPSNFSPFQGVTHSSLIKQPDAVLLGLRSTTHWQSSKRPGRIPCLLPRESPHDSHSFQAHTANWMSRIGTLEDLGHSRARISALTSTRSCAAF